MPDSSGRCGVIQNQSSKLINAYAGYCSNISVEPIEKRPFFHVLPGSKFLSVGFFGCSLACAYCLPGDTLIKTPDGLKRIDQIQDGEPIIAVDCSRSSPQPVLAHVGHVHSREAEEVIELEVGGQTIQLTPEHPVLTKRGWIEVGDLLEDDYVFCVKCEYTSLLL